jgi:membrane protein CcdC involved in cytochrome C biogenesis
MGNGEWGMGNGEWNGVLFTITHWEPIKKPGNFKKLKKPGFFMHTGFLKDVTIRFYSNPV